jgi:hypothetical protein
MKLDGHIIFQNYQVNGFMFIIRCISVIDICNMNNEIDFVCLFVLSRTSNFFSYLVTVTITGERAANLDLCLALTAFNSEGSFTCHTYCDTGPPF